MMNRSPVQLPPGIRLFGLPAGEKQIQFVALDDEDGIVLFDCGLPGFSQQSGVLADGRRVRKLILSHADADHMGDAACLKRAFPAMEVIAHANDREWIESPDLLVRERYDHAREQYNFGYVAEQLHALEAACGGGATVDLCVEPGTVLEIGGRSWTVFHVPGHSPGHIALWNAPEHILLLGDAVLGFGIPSLSGDLAMPPTHQFTADYLDTIEQLRALGPAVVLTGHWPALDSNGFSKLLEDSAACVHRDLAFVAERVRGEQPEFPALMQALNDAFRRWPSSEDLHYSYALAGYLDYLKPAPVVN